MNDARTWRVFIGAWDGGDPDWAHVDEQPVSWERAREALAEHMRPYLTDTCPDCRKAGTEGLAELAKAPADQPFEWNIDGEDYLIVPA